MAYEQLEEFGARQKELAGIIQDTQGLVEGLSVEHCVERLRELRRKTASDTFKIMVMGEFKTGKSTFIDALLGKEVLPAFAVPTTAIINEVKYGEEPRAMLHFLNPQPEEVYENVPEHVRAHIAAHEGESIPPIEVPIEELEDYVVIPMGMDRKKASDQCPYERVELFWPLDILRDGVELIDSPGLKENAVRTAVTMGYLSKADAVIFNLTAERACSQDEMRFLEEVLPQYGIDGQSLFCVVNRINQLRNDRNREMVRAYANGLLQPHTKYIFFVNALGGLEGRESGDAAMVEASQIPAFEEALTGYLANDRGRVKLATPARETVRCIRQDLLEGVIPQRRSALATDLGLLKSRYAEAQPEIERLRRQRELILAKTDALIAGMEPDIRRYALAWFNDLPAQVRTWVDEYEPATEVRILHLKADVNELATELNDFVSLKIDEEIRRWMMGPFSKMLEEKTVQLKDSLEGRLSEFYVSLDQVKLGITGVAQGEVETVPAWQRVVAGVGGLMLGMVDVAVVGAASGLNADFAKRVAIMAAAEIALLIAGLATPPMLIALIVGNALFSLKSNKDRAVEKVKAAACDQYCGMLSEKGMGLADSAVKAAMDNLGEVKDIVGDSLNTEIAEMQSQVEGIIAEVAQGEENVRQRQAELDGVERRLRETADALDTFIFELVKRS